MSTLQSMTGFGSGRCEAAGRSFTCEIRSVNHRYLDLKFRLPWNHPELERQATAAVKRSIERGSLSIVIEMRGEAATEGVRVNTALAASVHRALSEVSKQLGLAPPSLELVCAQPGVLQSGFSGADPNELYLAFEPALLAAIEALTESRRREGQALVEELASRVERIKQIAAEVAPLSGEIPKQSKRKLEERLARLLSPENATALDPNRIAQEVALIADKSDITEELARLATHLAELNRLLRAAGGPVGRKIEFLLQEVGREINTTGSKSQHVEIARLIVEAKAELEKFREQIQNVE